MTRPRPGVSTMDQSRDAGESPPQQGHARAGIRGAGPMVRVPTRIISFGFILCLLAVLVLGTSFEPQLALARPAPTGGPDGTPYGTGDPTGDDIPSPTPKPTAPRAAPASVTAGTTTHRVNVLRPIRWNLYLSILVRLGLR